jgi:hypothetical protein
MIKTQFYLKLDWINAPALGIWLGRVYEMPCKVEVGEKLALDSKDIRKPNRLMAEVEQCGYSLHGMQFEAIIVCKPFEGELEREDIANELIAQGWQVVDWSNRRR